MLRRWSISLLFAGALIAVAVLAPVVSSAPASGASARAFGVKIVIPGQGVTGTAEAAAPPAASLPGEAFAYPQDGSAVSAPSVSGAVIATSDLMAAATGSVVLDSLRLFGGEITVEHIAVEANASATADSASGDSSQTKVTGALFQGQPLAMAVNGRVELGDWGYMQTLVQTIGAGDPGTTGYHLSLRALDIHLTAEHGGLPAGSEIIIGSVEALAQARPETVTATIPSGRPKPPASTTGKEPSKDKKKTKKGGSGLVQPIPPDLKPKLSRKGYVFPVYGQAWYSDSFRAARADTGWHHGIDIFAPMGTPLLAVSKGTVFSVGWNNLGGNRFWLRDTKGNEFYYAHLSAFSPLAVNGTKVEAGDVIGFMGHSGDAITTPPHLHFEVHPAALLPRGYDASSANPYEWLVGLDHLLDVEFPEGTGAWAKQIASSISAQPAGAILLHSADISALPRLDSTSLEQLLGLGDSAAEPLLASD